AFLAIINGEFSLNIVAALLLIVGYSINDTVVTYDRVRENRRKTKTRMTFEEQLNLAMNQTLSRTILTSGSVVVVLIALLLFGGKVIHEFAWIQPIGPLAATNSTITTDPAVPTAGNTLTGRTQDPPAPAPAPRPHAGCGQAVPGDRARSRPRLPVHGEGQSRRRDHQRHRGPRPRQHRAGRRQAGHGRQGGPLQALRRHRRL